MSFSKSRSICGIVMSLSLWEFLAKMKNDPAIVPIESIVKASGYVFLSDEFVKNLASTVRILVTGVSIASIFGIMVAVVSVYDKRFWEIIQPTVETCRNIPSITLFPILLVMYGIGDASRVFVIFWTAFPPILISSRRGLSSVDKGMVEAGLALGMNDFQIMRYIQIPLASPSMLSGMRIGAGSGFVAIVVAEMLGATSGIGYMVLWTTNSFRYPETYVYILVIGLLGTLVNYVMEKAEIRMERKCS